MSEGLCGARVATRDETYADDRGGGHVREAPRRMSPLYYRVERSKKRGPVFESGFRGGGRQTKRRRRRARRVGVGNSRDFWAISRAHMVGI